MAKCMKVPLFFLEYSDLSQTDGMVGQNRVSSTIKCPKNLDRATFERLRDDTNVDVKNVLGIITLVYLFLNECLYIIYMS